MKEEEKTLKQLKNNIWNLEKSNEKISEELQEIKNKFEALKHIANYQEKLIEKFIAKDKLHFYSNEEIIK